MSALPDEYQDGVSAGSLVKAWGCWRELLAAGALHLPHRFTFVYQCPTECKALGLMDFLRSSHDAGYESTTDRVAMSHGDPWQVAGGTHAAIWSLSSLEHLFMRMRGAGRRHESTLVTLDLLPRSRGLP